MELNELFRNDDQQAKVMAIMDAPRPAKSATAKRMSSAKMRFKMVVANAADQLIEEVGDPEPAEQDAPAEG